MQEGRWTKVTPSQFDREREALDHIRRLLPNTEPYRAWSNFTFTADTGLASVATVALTVFGIC